MPNLKNILEKLLSLGLIVSGAFFLYLILSAALNKSSHEDALIKINHITDAETCESISPWAYETGLIMVGPSTIETYYYRSVCYMHVAVDTRNEKLCALVKERKSLFFNGSYYSPEPCRQAVSQAIQRDYAGRVKPEDLEKIKALNVELTGGNYYINVTTEGGSHADYEFSMVLLNEDGKFVGTIPTDNARFIPNQPLTFFLYRHQMSKMLGSPVQDGQTYIIQATLKLIETPDAAKINNLDPSLKTDVKSQKIVIDPNFR